MGRSEQSPSFLVVGANHRSSTATTRDRLFVEDDAQPDFLDRLRRAGLSQAMLLSTCARTEVQAVDPEPEAASAAISALFAERAGLPDDEMAAEIYAKRDAEAVRHVFRVAAAMDSPVIGEPQVAGQVRDGHRRARAAGMIGAELEALLSAAYGAAKRVRTETTIGQRPVSMAAAAHQLARDVHGDLAGCTALMLIGGDMGEFVAEHILASGLRKAVMTARVAARAEAAARRQGCHHAPIEDLQNQLAEADIVVTALGTGSHTITAAMVRTALRARRRKPILLIDAAIPGDITAEVDTIEDAFVYDLADLERIAEQGMAGREVAAREAEAVLDQEVARHLHGLTMRETGPAITALRAHFEAVRAEVLAEHGDEDMERITRRLVNRLLDGPSRALGRLAAGDDATRRDVEAMLEALFAIDPSGRAPKGDR